MAITEIIFFLNITSAAFAVLAMIFAIAATVITILYRPFRKEEPPATTPPETIQAPKRKQVIARIDSADIQTMKRLLEIPKTNPAGWMGTIEGREEAL